MNRVITAENLMSVVPYVLYVDSEKKRLAETVAEELVRLYESNDLLNMYANIDKLDEELLDILAYDFKVDWYVYDGTLQSKREQIKSQFDVHRHLGTKAATVRALSDLYPGTLIEEWFEYGGEPHHFRVLLDISEQLIPITEGLIVRLINIFKPVRSIMEFGTISLRSHLVIEVAEKGGYYLYNSRLCGTFPQAEKLGFIEKSVIETAVSGSQAGYQAPMTDQLNAGTYPTATVKGVTEGSAVDVAYDGTETKHYYPQTGKTTTGTVPRQETQGMTADSALDVSETEDNAVYSATLAGTNPEASVQGKINDKGVSFETKGESSAYDVRNCGTPFDSLI